MSSINDRLIINMRYYELEFMFGFLIFVTLDLLYTVSKWYSFGGHIHSNTSQILLSSSFTITVVSKIATDAFVRNCICTEIFIMQIMYKVSNLIWRKIYSSSKVA